MGSAENKQGNLARSRCRIVDQQERKARKARKERLRRATVARRRRRRSGPNARHLCGAQVGPSAILIPLVVVRKGTSSGARLDRASTLRTHELHASRHGCRRHAAQHGAPILSRHWLLRRLHRHHALAGGHYGGTRIAHRARGRCRVGHPNPRCQGGNRHR